MIGEEGGSDRRGGGQRSRVALICDAARLASKSPEPPPARTSGRPHLGRAESSCSEHLLGRELLFHDFSTNGL